MFHSKITAAPRTLDIEAVAKEGSARTVARMMRADIITTNWTDDGRARRILNSFRRTPPHLKPIPSEHRWDRDDHMYGGFRVECLKLIRASILTPAFREAQRRGDHDTAASVAGSLTVQDAVESALTGGDICDLPRVETFPVELDPAAWDAARWAA